MNQQQMLLGISSSFASVMHCPMKFLEDCARNYCGICTTEGAWDGVWRGEKKLPNGIDAVGETQWGQRCRRVDWPPLRKLALTGSS